MTRDERVVKTRRKKLISGLLESSEVGFAGWSNHCASRYSSNGCLEKDGMGTSLIKEKGLQGMMHMVSMEFDARPDMGQIDVHSRLHRLLYARKSCWQAFPD